MCISRKVDITVERKGMLYKLCFILNPILGKNSSDKLNLVRCVNIIHNLDKNNIFSEYSELFKGLECLPELI